MNFSVDRELLLAGAALLLAGCSPGRDNNVAPAIAEPVTVNALGRLEPRGSLRSIAAAAGIDGGRIGALYVEEGQRVRKGDALFSLDSLPRLQASLEHAARNESLAAARVQQARAGAKPGENDAQRATIIRLEREHALAVIQEERAARLVATGDLPAKHLEQRRLQSVQLIQEIERARSQGAAMNETRPTDIAVAEREHEVSQAATRRVRMEMSAATVVAPVDGTILRIYNRLGEAATNRVLDLGETSQMCVVAEVFESDIRRVRVGLAAEVTLPALGETLRGSVTGVGQLVGKRETLNSDPVAETDARVFRVEIRLDEASSRLAGTLTNMQVEVRLLLDSKRGS